MQIGGTLVSAVVRIAILAATLALVYFFIIRPVLDTTEKVSGNISGNIQQTIDSVQEQIKQTSPGVTQRKTHMITTEIKNIPTGKLPRLNRCIANASADIDKINRCVKRLSR